MLKTNMKTKKVLVLFSGGLDSTYLLVKNLIDGNNVIPVYVDTLISNTQKHCEIRSINKILENLSAKFPNMNSIKVARTEMLFPRRWYSPQPFVWLTTAYALANELNVNEVQVAYVMGDQSISYLENLKQIWKSFKLLDADSFKDVPQPKLSFPLIKTTKGGILNKLYSFDETLQEHIWFCENPVYSDFNEWICCGKCRSCRHFESEIDESHFPNKRRFQEMKSYLGKKNKIIGKAYNDIDARIIEKNEKLKLDRNLKINYIEGKTNGKRRKTAK